MIATVRAAENRFFLIIGLSSLALGMLGSDPSRIRVKGYKSTTEADRPDLLNRLDRPAYLQVSKAAEKHYQRAPSSLQPEIPPEVVQDAI